MFPVFFFLVSPSCPSPAPPIARTSSSSCRTTTRRTRSAPTDRASTRRRTSIGSRARGCCFTNVFATNSICTPSRAAISHRQYSHLNGVTMFNRFDSSRMTVARSCCRQGGYHTGMIGKWHLGSDPAGFDRWEILPGQGAYIDPVLYTATGEKTYTGRYVTDVITDLAIDFIKNAPARQAVLPDAPPQGAAPAVGAGRRASRAVRRPLDPRAGDALGFLCDADRCAAREPAARRRRPDAARSEAAAAGGPERRSSRPGCRRSPTR